MVRSKDFLWNAIGTTLNSFLSMFYLIIITRVNGIELSGIFSFSFSIALLLQTLTNFGGRIYQVTDINEEFSLSEYLGIRALMSVIGIIISIIICRIYHSNLMGYLLTITLVLVKIIETFSDVIYGEFQKNERIDLIGKSLVIKSTITIIAFLIVNLITKDLILSTFVILIFTFLFFLVFDIKKCNKKISLKMNYNLIKKTKNLFVTNFILLIILNVPKFVGKIFLNEVDFGYLGIILMIPTVMLLFSQFIIVPILNKLTIYYNTNDINNSNKLIKQTILILICITVVCILAAIFLGKTVLGLLYGVNFDGYVIAFVLLILSGMFNSFSSLFMNVLTILRKINVQVVVLVIVTIIVTILSITLSKFFGIYGLISALLIAMIIENFIFYIVFICHQKQLVNGKEISYGES